MGSKLTLTSGEARDMKEGHVMRCPGESQGGRLLLLGGSSCAVSLGGSEAPQGGCRSVQSPYRAVAGSVAVSDRRWR